MDFDFKQFRINAAIQQCLDEILSGGYEAEPNEEIIKKFRGRFTTEIVKKAIERLDQAGA